MENKSKKSKREWLLQVLSKPINYLSKNQESLVDPTNRHSSALLNVSQGPETSMNAQDAQSRVVPGRAMVSLSSELPAGQLVYTTRAASTVSVVSAPTPDHGPGPLVSFTSTQIAKTAVDHAVDLLGMDSPVHPASAPPKVSAPENSVPTLGGRSFAVPGGSSALLDEPSMGYTTTVGPSSAAAQITKNLVKGVLGVLSSAAEGMPIPGIKGVFDTITKVIGGIEVCIIFQYQINIYQLHW